MGLLAGDEETYTVFADLFDPVIEEYHNGFKKTGICYMFGQSLNIENIKNARNFNIEITCYASEHMDSCLILRNSKVF